MSLASISRSLDKSGVVYRTLVPERGRPTAVYVVDLDNSLRKQVLAAARTLRARSKLITGSGAFIGNDTDRDKAQVVFGEAINKFEAEHPDVAKRCAR